MTKNEKYTSLELSKKIDDLAKKKGIELESEYYWTTVALIPTVKNGMKSFEWQLHKEKDDFDDYSGECIPALDTAELREMMEKKWIETYMNAGKVSVMIYECPQFDEDTFAEAMGKMYFYLLDNNLL